VGGGVEGGEKELFSPRAAHKEQTFGSKPTNKGARELDALKSFIEEAAREATGETEE
jgi:hypothetical protein